MRTAATIVATLLLTFAYTALYEMAMRRLRPESFRPAETQEDMSNDGCQTSIAMLLLGCLAIATVLGLQFILGL